MLLKKLLFSGAVLALTAGMPQIATAEAPSMISFGVGVFDAFDNDQAVDLRAEYRSGKSVIFTNLHPYAGLEITTEGTTWVGGGLYYDYNFSPNWYLTPSLGVGLYNQGGSDKDLDHVVEFRTQLEVSYEFENQHRVGLSFTHMSNAGLGDENPGTEAVGLYWHIPFNKIF